MEDRIGWQGQNESQIGGEEKKNGRFVGAAETSKERAEWRRLQRKNLSILGLPKRKEWPQCHRESSWQERRSRPCQKEKEYSRQTRIPDHKEGESQGGREPHLGERGGTEREHGEERVESFFVITNRCHNPRDYVANLSRIKFLSSAGMRHVLWL